MTDEQLKDLAIDLWELIDFHGEKINDSRLFFGCIMFVVVQAARMVAPDRESVKELLQDVINDALLKE